MEITLENILASASQHFALPIAAPNEDNDGSDAVCNAFYFMDALYWFLFYATDEKYEELEAWMLTKSTYSPSPLAGDVESDNIFIDMFGDNAIKEFLEKYLGNS